MIFNCIGVQVGVVELTD